MFEMIKLAITKTIKINNEDWTEQVTMSIDPSGCRDVDDCLSVK